MKPILDLSKNNDYRSWVKELKQRYLSARLKASIEANRTLLEYYWSLGRDIADKQYANTYGSGFYKTLSHDLRSEMPEEKGFSESNIRYMYRFYELYNQEIVIFRRVRKNCLSRYALSRGIISVGLLTNAKAMLKRLSSLSIRL